jgi:exodeoxyribonuclease V alpha subunit
VKYDYGELDEVSLAYAVSIHKSQGSEFPAVVIPLAMQYYMLLQRNLIYTGITRGKRLLVLVGQRKALGIGGADSASCQTRMQTSDSVRQQTRCSTNLSGTTT